MLGDIIRQVAGNDPVNTAVAVGWFVQAVGAMLALLGSPALYARQAETARRLGLVGLLGLSLFFFLFGVFGGLLHSLLVPEVEAANNNSILEPMSVGLSFLVGTIGVLVGGVCFGIAVLRTRSFPAPVAWLLFGSGAALIVGHPIGHRVEDVGLALLLAGLAWAARDLLVKRSGSG